MPGGPVTVMVGEFEDIVLRGLQALIEADENLRLAGLGVPTEGLASALRTARPRVAVLNYGSVATAGTVRELSSRFPATRLVVLANRPSPAEARQLLSFGATACLSKSSEARDILHAIHLASRGMNVLPAPEAGAVAPLPPELLTGREAEVLGHLQAGRSNGEIASAMHLSVETVRTHARNIYRKLGVGGRRELRS